MGIKSIESTGSSEIPEDIFGISAHVDDAVIYELRPTYFREEWVGVVIPPMFQADGSYFDSKNIELTFTVRGTENGGSTVAMSQNLSAVTDGESLLSLINDVETELASINSERENLFQEMALLEKWNEMYPLACDSLAWLSERITSMNETVPSEVTTIGGTNYSFTQQDIAMAELMIENITTYESEDMVNTFLDAMPDTSRMVVKKLTNLLGYVLPGAFVCMTRGLTENVSGNGAIASILTAAVPAACMCVAGNCLRNVEEARMETASILGGINWYANILINQGLSSLNNEMVCDFGNDSNVILKLVTNDSIDLLDDISESLLSDTQWSNSTPWSNGSPWNNNTSWNNAIWTNQPWSHTPWNNTAPWSNNPWNNNIWSHTPPWDNNVWNNTPPWDNNVWSNTPSWDNNTWSNNWSNNPWSNNPWSNFVNSGTKVV